MSLQFVFAMNRIPTKALVLSLWIILFVACREPNKGVDTYQNTLDSFYTMHPEAHGILLHITGPDLSESGAFGWADSTAGIRMESNTPFLIASITKMYMSAAILRLTELYPVHLDSSIEPYISTESLALLKSDGYKTDKITLAHLLLNSSGIADYAESDSFQALTQTRPSHSWKRNEQIQMAMRDFDPLNEPGEGFHYSDVNFLLLGEILERYTRKPFYSAVRNLLKFEENGLYHTWWNQFESAPGDLPPLAHQFAHSYQVDSKNLHPSFDIYGGGGLVCTAKDLALFTKYLFEGKFFSDTATLKQLTGRSAPGLESGYPYRLGVMYWEKDGFPIYGHGGFWGSMVQYFPDIKTAIVMVPMERNYWKEADFLCGQFANRIRSAHID